MNKLIKSILHANLLLSPYKNEYKYLENESHSSNNVFVSRGIANE